MGHGWWRSLFCAPVVVGYVINPNHNHVIMSQDWDFKKLRLLLMQFWEKNIAYFQLGFQWNKNYIIFVLKKKMWKKVDACWKWHIRRGLLTCPNRRERFSSPNHEVSRRHLSFITYYVVDAFQIKKKTFNVLRCLKGVFFFPPNITFLAQT